LILKLSTAARARRCVLPGIFAAVIGLGSGPTLAAPTVSATDHDINWGALEQHFPQNKQAESPMASNPTDALNSITGAEDFFGEPDCTADSSTGGSDCLLGQTINTIGVYTTQDGGANWAKQIIDFSAIGRLANADPGVTFGPKPNGQGGFSYANGARAYFSAMAFPFGNLSFTSEPVVAVATSDDRGTTWSTPVLATDRTNPRAQFDDKPMIWADNNPSSPYFGSVYLVWAFFRGVGSGGATLFCDMCPVSILITRSTDGGQTWSVPVSVSSSAVSRQTGRREGPFVRTDREGRVIIVWEDNIFATNGQSQILSVVATDGGKHFGSPVVVGATLEQDPLPGTSFPNAIDVSLDVDQSSDTIYATWADYRPIDTVNGHGVVTVMKSFDHGVTWAKAGSIDVPGRSPFHPSLAVARQGTSPVASATPARVLIGFTAVTDVPASTAPVASAVNYLPFVAASDDGGFTWSSPTIPAGAAASDPSAAAGFFNDFRSEFVGDYSSASAAPDGKTFYYSYTSAQSGSGCAAVDAFRLGIGPQPNIYTSCAPIFGNVDIHVAVVGS
jgi:hypothetical protein